MATDSARPVRRSAEDYFFLAMAVLLFAAVFIGFARTYYLADPLKRGFMKELLAAAACKTINRRIA